MNKVIGIVQKKPPVFLILGLVYLFVVGFFRWQVTPSLDTLYFLGGGLLGIYFLDTAEVFFNLAPSPFRSIVFVCLYAVVGLFVVTSSSSFVARGLVLTVHLMLLILQVSDWRKTGNLSSWYEMVAGVVSVRTQELLLAAFGVLFLVETYLFIR